MFQRPHLEPLVVRMQEPRRFIQVIMGPRQVGKTTLVIQLVEQINKPSYFASTDTIAASNTMWLAQQWESARLTMDAQQASEFLLVIDEIQKIENWSETVKLLWDTDTRNKRNLKVILLGSSRLLVQQGLTESLAGRFERTYMGHWSFHEMEQAFGWSAEQYVWFGGYPGSQGLIQEEERWKAYVQQALVETSISRDILMLRRVDKPALMRRLFELGCLYSGQILSYTKILGQLQDAGNTNPYTRWGPTSAVSSDFRGADFWFPGVVDAQFPGLLVNTVDKWHIAQSFYVEDASFFRLKNIMMGYMLPAKLTNRAKLKTVRLYGSIDNIWVYSKATVPDPEAVAPDGYSSGNDYPLTRKFTVGLEVNF